MEELADKKIFLNTKDATLKLLDILPLELMKSEDWLLVAISPRAVPMAKLIADRLEIYYDVLFTEPIYAPNNNECKIAMISESEEMIVCNEFLEAFDIKLDYLYGEAKRKYEEKILNYIYKYRKGELCSSFKDRKVLFIDVGSETGLIVNTAIKTAMNKEAKSVMLALPVIPKNIESYLEKICDELYTIDRKEHFVSIGFYYQNLNKLSADEVLEIVEECKHYLPFAKQQIGENK